MNRRLFGLQAIVWITGDCCGYTRLFCVTIVRVYDLHYMTSEGGDAHATMFRYSTSPASCVT